VPEKKNSAHFHMHKNSIEREKRDVKKKTGAGAGGREP
jgi:hypothetical protein